VQAGNGYTQIVNITLKELAEKIAVSDDEEAKNLFIKLLENPFVASITGAGATALLTLITK
jgi:hypothetical protein